MSAAIHNVTASPRTTSGKGAARRLRNSGQIPAVAYGKDLAAISLSIAPKDVVGVLKSERGQNTVLNMSVSGQKDLLVMIKEYTYHPVTRSLEHVDFVEVKLDKPVEVEIPLIPIGKAVGLAEGGILRQVYRTIPVRCVPDKIPLKVDADVTKLALGEAIATKDLKLPEGVEVLLPEEQTVLAVVAPDKDRTEDEATAAAGAAPAAGAAAPAAAGAAGAKPAAGAAAGAKPAAGAAAAAPAKDAKKK